MWNNGWNWVLVAKVTVQCLCFNTIWSNFASKQTVIIPATCSDPNMCFVLASQIAEIFQWSLQGLLHKLTEHAQTFCLTPIHDGSFQSFTVGDLNYVMTAAFGPKIFHARHEAHHHVSWGPAPTTTTHTNMCPLRGVGLTKSLHTPPHVTTGDVLSKEKGKEGERKKYS